MQIYNINPKVQAKFADWLEQDETVLWAEKGIESLNFLIVAVIVSDVIIAAIFLLMALGVTADLGPDVSVALIAFLPVMWIMQFFVFRHVMTRYFCLTDKRLLKISARCVFEIGPLNRAEMIRPDGANFIAFGHTVKITPLPGQTDAMEGKALAMPTIAGVPDIETLANGLSQSYHMSRTPKFAPLQRILRPVF